MTTSESGESPTVEDPTLTVTGRGGSIVTRGIYGEEIKETFDAKAIRAVDGDTIELLLDDGTHPNFRLASIDAPEKNQPFGSKATEAVKELCVGKNVTVHQTGCLLYTSPSPRDQRGSRMPSSA